MTSILFGTSVLLLLACCDNPPHTRQPVKGDDPRRQEAIEPWLRITAPDWLAVIHKDGSGQIGYGSSAVDVAHFPRGTFDLDSVVRRLKPKLVAKRPNPGPNVFGAQFIERNRITEDLWAKSPEPIAEVFELFRQAHKSGKAKELNPGIIEKCWRYHPPTPVSKSWDAKPDKTEASKRGLKNGTGPIK